MKIRVLRGDYLDLTKVLQSTASSSVLTKAAQVVNETPKERRLRHLGAFEAEEKKGIRGALQRTADSLGVDRSYMSKGIKTAKSERAEQKRSGLFVSQLVRDGKRKA